MSTSSESEVVCERTLAAPPDRLRILCIEDNEGDYLLVREHFKDAGFERSPEVDRIASLRDAVEHLEVENRGGRYDVILLDLSLPDSNGPVTFDRVFDVAGKTPVIILSGNEDRDVAVEMVQRGAQDFLPKNTLNGDMLMRSILYALERQRSHLELSGLNDQLRAATHELKTAQMQLIQAEKLDSLGRLAAGVAHEVKNPLATLQMGVDYFGRRSSEFGEPGEMMIECMQDAITRADQIIRGMVDYSRSDALTLRLRNVNVTITNALRMVRHELLKHNVTVDQDLTDPIPDVRIDEGKIEQVLINLFVNAIQAMSDGDGVADRRLLVRTIWGQLEAIEGDQGLRELDHLRVRDPAVVVEIRDCGPGISQDKLTRIFEPFFTTKPTGQGTGLGLSVAKNIVDLHRGRIEVKNAENPRGLRVCIVFKAHQLNDRIKQLSPPTPLPSNGRIPTARKP